MLRKVLLVIALLFSGVVFVLSRHVELTHQAAQGNAPAELHSEFVPRNPGIARDRDQQFGASAADIAPPKVIGSHNQQTDHSLREPVSLRGSLSVPREEPEPEPEPERASAAEEPASEVKPQAPVEAPEFGDRAPQPKFDVEHEPKQAWAPAHPEEPQQPPEPEMPEPAQLQMLQPELVTPQSRPSKTLQRTLRRVQSLKASHSDLSCTSPAVLLHQLLRHGEFSPDQPQGSSKTTSSAAKTTLTLHDTVQSELQPTGLFLEYSSSAPDKSLAFWYAASQVRSTVVHVYLANGEQSRQFYKPSPSNLLVIPSAGRSIDQLRLRDTKACAAQLLAGWEDLVQDMLPHEFENAIGRLLCQCDATIAPANLPISTFFSYWGTVHQLIAEATAAAELQDCKLTVSTLRTPYVPNSEPVERQIKITKSSKQENDSGADDSGSGSSTSSSSRFRSAGSTTGDDTSELLGPSSSSPSSSSSSLSGGTSSSSSMSGGTSSSSSSRFRAFASAASSGTIMGESAHAMLNKDLSGIAFSDLVALGVADSDLANLACTLFDHTDYRSQSIQYSDLVFVAGAARKNPSSDSDTHQSQYGGNSRSFTSGGASEYSRRSDTWLRRRLTSEPEVTNREEADANEVNLRRKLATDLSNEYADWLFPAETDIQQTETPEPSSTMTSLTDGVRLRQAHLARQEVPQLKQWAEVLKQDFAGTTTAAVFGR
jgi:hypothetical protein